MTRPDLVVDSSALVLAGTQQTVAASALRTRLRVSTVHAPHLVDAEVGNSLRGLLLGGRITAELADAQRVLLPALVGKRYDQRGSLSDAAWSYPRNVTFYDGLYVALAVALGCVLVTADARLGRAPRLPCRLEVVR